MLLSIVDVLEHDRYYRNTNPFCEPQLGQRGLYRAIGGAVDGRSREVAMLWVLNFSDGHNSLLDIAHRADLPFDVVRETADVLAEHNLLEPL
jgi:aminopeptidase-like protein